MSKESLLKDPKGESACSTRRRMSWAIWLVGAGVLGTALAAALMGNESGVLEAAIWAGTVLVIVGPVIYYLGRAALERVLSKLANNVETPAG